MLATTDSPTTLLPDLLVDNSTVMFSRQYPDSAAARLLAWPTQLVESLLSSPHSQPGLAATVSNYTPPTQQRFTELLLL